jgi:hypothetical protein
MEAAARKIDSETDSLEDLTVRFKDCIERRMGARTLDETVMVTYCGLFEIAAHEELNLTKYEINACLAYTQSKILQDDKVQRCVKFVGPTKVPIAGGHITPGSVKRVVEYEVIDPEQLEAVLRRIMKTSELIQSKVSKLPGFVTVPDYLRQNHPKLFWKLTADESYKRLGKIGKELVQAGIIQRTGKRLRNCRYYFRRDFRTMDIIDKFISERYVSLYLMIAKVVAEELRLTGKESSRMIRNIRRRCVRMPDIKAHLSSKGLHYIHYGHMDKVEAKVRSITRGYNKNKPVIGILYAVWDCEEAYKRVDELLQKTKDRIDLRFDVIDLSKEDKVDKLRRAMMFGQVKDMPRYDFVIVNLGKDGQAGWAYFFADVCNIGLGRSTLVAESSNGTNRRDESRLYCDEFITSLAAKPKHRESFEALLGNGS